ncbi:MAG TPA: hypothetical protein VFG32_06525 [Bacteroidota bacterium]|nr:hypothetical protein [Bacteroidota bacterium]
MSIAPVFSWWAQDSVDFILPNVSLSGFRLKTFGLPAISNSYTWYYVEPESGESEDDTSSIFVDAIVLRTIAPHAPPSPFVALDFIDTLIAMKNEAKSLDWIQQSDLSDLIDTRLSKARDHVESEDESGALEDLQVALSAVEKDCLGVGPGPGVSYLTSEACALLRYNLQYLIDYL